MCDKITNNIPIMSRGRVMSSELMGTKTFNLITYYIIIVVLITTCYIRLGDDMISSSLYYML